MPTEHLQVVGETFPHPAQRSSDWDTNFLRMLSPISILSWWHLGQFLPLSGSQIIFLKPLSPAALPAESLWKQEPQLRGFVCPLKAVPDRIMLLPTEAALLELERLVFLNAATRILVSAP